MMARRDRGTLRTSIAAVVTGRLATSHRRVERLMTRARNELDAMRASHGV